MKLYIETTVPNFLFATMRRKAPRDGSFFGGRIVGAQMRSARKSCSEELIEAPAGKRDSCFGRCPIWNRAILPMTAEAAGLCQLYLDHGILPPRYYNDAIQIALCACHANGLFGDVEHAAHGKYLPAGKNQPGELGIWPGSD